MAAQHRAGKYPAPRDPSATDTIVLRLGATQKSLVETAPAVSIRTVFRAFWPFTAQFRTRLYLSLGMVVLPPLLGAASMWMLKILIDDVLTPRNTGLFPKVAMAFVALTVCGGVVSFIDEYLNAWVAERFVLILRSRVFDHLQTLSLTFFGERQLGDLLSRLTGDINAIEQLILSGVNQTLTYIFQILFFSGALFWLDWRLALAAFIAAPGFMLLARFFSHRIKNASRELRRRSGSITSVAEESLHNIALVQAYHQEATQSRRFRTENLGSFAAQMLATKLEALFAPFTDLMQMVGVLLVVGLGIRELVAGRITLGGLLVFLGYLSQLYGPISGFGHLVNSIYAASAGADRIFELLDTRPEAVDPDQPKRLEQVRGALRVERLGFRYPDTERPTLHGVSFSVEPGETVAVVGASGAGKSTLLRLLLRLHQQAYGTVLLDGVDTRELTIAQLRSSIAVVLQETLVFDGTIEENIHWGRPDATDVDVVEAAKAADAHSFITGLPNGYQTRIGQRGMMLSGGQRQRIALARAIIRDAPVLLLDEPTTGLDAASAARVLEPLRRAMSGRTTVVISHNLLTVTDADRIVYLEQGRVGGYGTHTELMARCPGYAELYRLHHPDQPGLPPILHRLEARAGTSPSPGPRPRPNSHLRPSPRPRPRPGAARQPVGMPPVPAPLSAVLPLLPQVSGLATQPVRAVRPDRSGDGRPVAIPIPRRQGGPVGTPAARPVAPPPEPVQRATPGPLPSGASTPVRWEDDDWVR